ncbi:MAG: hydrogenase expression/formation protein HypE, partial [Bacteroidota bacterium]
NSERAEAIVNRLRSLPYGTAAQQIGTIVSEHPGKVLSRSRIGGRRVVTMLLGEQLPRIC